MTYCLKNFMDNDFEKHKMKIRKYFSIKDNENLAYSNLWDTATVSRG